MKIKRIIVAKNIHPFKFLEKIKEEIIKEIKIEKKPIKIKLYFHCRFIKPRFVNFEHRGWETTDAQLYSKVESIFEATDLEETVSKMIKTLEEEIENFVTKGSGL